MDVSKLAVLTNLLGGYDETESAIGVPADLIQKAIEGNALTGYENALLETGFNRLYLEDDRGIDLEYHFGQRFNKFGDAIAEGETTGSLNVALGFLVPELQNDFRGLVADGAVDLDDLNAAYGIFANLTPHQQTTVIEGLRDGDANASDMIRAYVDDGYDFWDVEESEFWDWFRETFYPEA